MPIWQLCANLLIPNCLRSNLSYSPLAALELYVNDIKAYLLEWKQLVKYNKELLAYASSSLKLNKFDVEAAFMQEYSDLIEKKSTAQLHVVK